ncbi:MAG TPA: hypothetical protein VHK91_11770 [Flavisolibacter sp.]|jgi:hypothetical protein|nr:hypothetical protein [Flavisolibacter sp.]
MKKSFFAVALLFLSGSVFSQQAGKAIFFELGGPGLASFNYDTRFSKKEDGIGGRIGFGGFSVDGSGAIFIPAGLNYIIGKDGKHYFELGAGATFVSTFDKYSDPYYGDDDGNFKSTFGHLNFGYRLQPREGGFFFRAAINPVFGKGFFVPYYGGISFGYKFGSSKN